LDKVADVKVEWVNSLSLHLEFDNVRRRLKVFRFPSFCRLMYSQETTLLSRLYIDHCRYFRDHGLEDTGDDQSQEYFREVLLSYRLIFGQDKESWRMFRKKSAKWEPKWNWSDHQSEDFDPLLLVLCGESYLDPGAKALYEEIDAAELSPYYFPDTDFPFLGRRLLNLQTFVRGRNPHSWKALWYDRRSMAFWWTFWAVLFIGGGTILLSFLQLAFSVWSGVSGQRQLGGFLGGNGD